jgi:signal transduction histidine kinase
MLSHRAIDTSGDARPPGPYAARYAGQTHALPSQEGGNGDRWRLTLTVCAATASIAVAWLLLVFVVDQIRFVVLNPRAKTGFEIFLALAQIFGAFVLAVSPIGPIRRRVHRVAAAFLVLGIGALSLGYLYPLLVDDPVLSATMYGSLYVRAISMLLIAAGLATPRIIELHLTTRIAIVIVIVTAGVALVAMSEQLPPLLEVGGMTTVVEHDPALDTTSSPGHAHLADVEALVGSAHTVFPGLTGWHTGLSLIPLAVGVIAAAGAARQHARRALGTWLLIAVVLLAGSQLHSLFWPSMYSSILTTTSVLRLGVAVVIVVGGVLELRSIVEERARLLASEQERVRRLEELATLKADFTSIVAHELASPLAAINALSEMVATGTLRVEQAQAVARSIGAEAQALQKLVDDVRASADTERDDFRVELRPVPVATLLQRAEAYGRTLPGDHPLTVERDVAADVLADPDRIGQVLRNLLSNAAIHTPPDTPIALRARPGNNGVVIEVADAGPGVSPHDRSRIFEKFGRGQDVHVHDVPGRGLGLYLSRRILHAHGSDLKLDSAPGQGATFAFTLETVP